MRIENLVGLINGVMQNNAQVSQISGFSFEAKSVKRAYVYICLMADSQQIELALKNGAYAIITSEKIEINDNEVAHIRVENIQTAISRLMRYFASQKALKLYCVNAVQMAILNKIQIKNAYLLNDDLLVIFKSIEAAAFGSVFFGTNTRILQQLNPLYEHVSADMKTTAINTGSIFFTNTICDGVYYQGLGLAQVFLPSFSGLIKFLNKNGIGYRINDIKNLGHFEPIFIDKNFLPVSFGSSFRAIICESDEELFRIEANYLLNKFSSDEIKIAVLKTAGFTLDGVILVDDLDEIKEFRNFRYLLVFGKKQDVLSVLSDEKPTLTLF